MGRFVLLLFAYSNEALLGLQGVIITNIEISAENYIIYADMKWEEHNCTCCGTATMTTEFKR